MVMNCPHPIVFARALLPGDPKSPIRVAGTWYAITADTPDPATWTRVAGPAADRLEELLSRDGAAPLDGDGEDP